MTPASETTIEPLLASVAFSFTEMPAPLRMLSALLFMRAPPEQISMPVAPAPVPSNRTAAGACAERNTPGSKNESSSTASMVPLFTSSAPSETTRRLLEITLIVPLFVSVMPGFTVSTEPPSSVRKAFSGTVRSKPTVRSFAPNAIVMLFTYLCCAKASFRSASVSGM